MREVSFHWDLVFKLARALIFFNLILSINCFAQIDHYWSQNFNTASALLSGAVVGGESETSSIFYNPAQISQQNEQNFALTASLFKYERYRLRNAVGEDVDLKRDIFRVVPKFISYSKSKDDKIDFQIAIFTRNEQKISFFSDVSSTIDILSQPDGEEFYNADVQYKVDYKDQWVAAGFSRDLGNGLNLGLGNYVSIKNLRNEYEINLRAFPQEDTVLINGTPSAFYLATTSSRTLLKIVDIRLLWKLGLQYNKGQWGIGLTATTPSVGVYGDGYVKGEVSRSNIFDPQTGGRVVDFGVTDYQEKVKADLKDPFAIAVGLHYQSPDKKNSLLFTAEYFFPIEVYEMLEIEQDTQQATTTVQDSLGGSILPTKRKANGVLNLALGYRKYFSEKISFLGGFRTDFSSADKDFISSEDNILTRIPYNQYHLTVGGAFVIQEKIEIIGGLQFSKGGLEDVNQLANFSNPVEYNPMTGQSLQAEILPIMEVNYFALSLFFGFTYDIFQ